MGFGGEESAGASFLRFDGTVWTTDKDGFCMDLLASEIIAKTGESPSAYHRKLVEKHGESWYARIDAPATREQKAKLKNLSATDVTATELAGEEITARLVTAPGNGEPIGGLKVTTKDAWFAARPSGTGLHLPEINRLRDVAEKLTQSRMTKARLCLRSDYDPDHTCFGSCSTGHGITHDPDDGRAEVLR